jgi:Ca2+-binding EF-hand superfamily protein
MFDTDGNGSIDSYEFVCALSLLSHATLDEKAELIFNLYDFDRS